MLIRNPRLLYILTEMDEIYHYLGNNEIEHLFNWRKLSGIVG